MLFRLELKFEILSQKKMFVFLERKKYSF
jgi:hypothetical protein